MQKGRWPRGIVVAVLGFACSEQRGDGSSDLMGEGGSAGASAAVGGAGEGAVATNAGGLTDGGQQSGPEPGPGTTSVSGGEGGAAGLGGADNTAESYPVHRLASWDGSIPSEDVCSIDGWCWVDPTPPANGLVDVWSSAPNDVWMVGKAGTLLHYDGVSYRGITGVEHAVGAIGPDSLRLNFVAVRGSSSTNVWALSNGGDWMGDSTERHVFRFDGSRWTEAPYPGKLAAHSLWVSGDNDVWLFGEAGKASHWDGTAWLDTPTGTVASLGKAWGFASNDVYVAAPPGVRHWNGKSWQDRSTGIPATVIGPLSKPIVNPIAAVWGPNANDVWATGNYGAYRSQNGGNWVSVNPDFSAYDIVGISSSNLGLMGNYPDVRWSVWDPQNGGTNSNSIDNCQFNAIWPASASSYLLVGEQVKFDATDVDYLCTVSKLDLLQPSGPLQAIGTGKSLAGQLVWAAAPDELYELGYDVTDYGHLWKRVHGTRVDTGLARSWSLQTTAFSARASDDVWLSDPAAGAASHWDGKSWTSLTTCKGALPTGVSVSSSGDAFLACDQTLYQFNGATFEILKTFDAPIKGFAAAMGHVWVLADMLYALSSETWSSVAVPVEMSGWSQTVLGADDGGALWLGAADGTFRHPAKIARLLDDSWQVYEPSPGFVDFDGPRSFAVRGYEVWLSVWGSGTFRFNGSKFDGYATGCETMPIDISIAGPGEVWLRAYGALLRYRDP